MSIQRQTLREQIETEIMDRVGAGEFRMGDNINEVSLSEELGVSRTPLREALISLSQQGVITRVSGKGFRWAPIGANDFTEAVQIIAALEGLALRLTPASELARIGRELAAQAHEFTASVSSAADIHDHDDAFHALLASGSPNKRLAETVASYKLALRRYERLYVGNADLMERAAAEHEAIAEALLANDLPAAIAALEANWLNSVPRIINALKAKVPAV
ncbi:DNA-binding GntR family transcriptional regulator [Arthrobacter silviterrae]|uniref:GntR family transcriptional regulator n=1 Tax=Arthrobacter silviterrae TaxID=2026658 RepID=A0ABX0DCB5_9MICC|nr:GntR family transcriptional regulator [Arthrobacter silviterrae]MDQ0276631.1 DNA-binding GntR family transcriptional regulator [Arthrobacter silviterrae]NGN84569.1 GntR family transcriptional regulator [Arthrobacter silviterrae]